MHDGCVLTLLPHILRKHRIWRKTKLRIFCVAQLTDNSLQMKKDLENLLRKFRIKAEAVIVELGDYDISEFTYERTMKMQKQQEMLNELQNVGASEVILCALLELICVSSFLLIQRRRLIDQKRSPTRKRPNS